MKVNYKITKKINKEMLNIYLDFSEMRDEFLIISLCSIVGYLQQSKIEVKISENEIYIDNELAVNLEINQDQIHITVFLERMSGNVNGMLVFIGIQTYLKIYFNLYENNEYYKIVDFYKKIGTF